MTAEHLFNLWRNHGGPFWSELSVAQQKQWDWVKRGVEQHAEDEYQRGRNDGINEERSA